MAEGCVRQTQEGDVSEGQVQVQGTHTFSSLLTYVPGRLVDQTADGSNLVDLFSIVLHLCNESVSFRPLNNCPVGRAGHALGVIAFGLEKLDEF